MSHILDGHGIPFRLFLCYVFYVMKMIVVSVNIGMHNMRPLSALVTSESHNRLYLVIGMFVSI
jgi:hypothetical protein